jgi:hypothetical protein
LASGIGKGRFNVFGFEIRKVVQDFVLGHAIGKHAKNVGDADAHSANAGAPATLGWLDCDSFQKFHVASIVH